MYCGQPREIMTMQTVLPGKLIMPLLITTCSHYQNLPSPGGIASNSEAYYSYNYGNTHFISLDSYGWESGSTRLYDTLGSTGRLVKAGSRSEYKIMDRCLLSSSPLFKGFT
jgi:hypothetical protein